MASKTSSDILNELFSTYNATFDAPQSSSSSSSSSSDDDSKSKKKKKKSKSSKKDKAKAKDKLGKKDGKSKKLKEKDKSKNEKEKSKKKKERSASKGKDDDSKAFKPTTIVLDIEEGEILDEEEKALRKSAKKRKEAKDSKHESPVKKKPKVKSSERSKSREQLKPEVSDPRKKSNKHKHEADYEKSRRRIGSDGPGKVEERRRSSNSASGSSSTTHRRHHSSTDKSSHRDGHSRDRGTVLRSLRQAPPREKQKDQKENDHDHHDRARYESSSSRSSSYQSSYKTSWQKASSRDTSYSSDRTYYYNQQDTRRSYNDYDRVARDREQCYGVGRSGFGYSGSRKYYDEYDDYYDYKRRSSRYSGSSSRRGRSRSRSRDPEDVIDKVKLLEIARRNAAKLMKKGCLPTDIFSRDQIVAIRAGGKSVEELTEYCQKLAEKDARGDLKDDAESSEDEHFINHPFQVKDRPLPSIVMNIRNAIPLPVRSAHELALENAKLKVQFPVSSGTRHRYKELEWRPVEDDDKEKEKSSADSKSLVPVGTVAPLPKETDESGAEGTGADGTDTEAQETATSSGPLAITAGPSTEEAEKPKLFKDTTINKIPQVTVDISELISMRLRAMRKLEENPQDDDAKEDLELATKEMKNWAEAKALEPKFLTQAEITSGPQAWVRKDQLINTEELKSGMGLHLLQKMGWRPGEGLGKNKEGPTTPLALEIKMDKKGLSSVADYPEKGPSLPNVFDLSGKHPVSSLMELCMKRKWGQPTFDMCFEHGPSHKKQFVYKVTVNGVEYQPCIATNNKKLAKAQSAAFCLQSLGLLPTTLPKDKKGVNPDTWKSIQTLAPKAKPTFLKTVPTPIPDPKPVPPPLSEESIDSAPAPSPSTSIADQTQILMPPPPRPRPVLLQRVQPQPLLPTPRFQPRNHQRSVRPPPRNSFMPSRPSKYAAPMYRVPRNPGPGGARASFAQLWESYDPMESMPSMDDDQGMSFDESYESFDDPMQMEMQVPQDPNVSMYKQAAHKITNSMSQFLRPAQPPPPPPQVYPGVAQVQVPLPQESGFPGLITF